MLHNICDVNRGTHPNALILISPTVTHTVAYLSICRRDSSVAFADLVNSIYGLTVVTAPSLTSLSTKAYPLAEQLRRSSGQVGTLDLGSRQNPVVLPDTVDFILLYPRQFSETAALKDR
ncbi:hypothetical protein N7G274_001402 [Stereocaulon virgatum]|uniref:Uncharacterized protein n=1 Tax=Stereocaulon virgatum TaxID=373712 RepID=A0ABR4AP98_9LECA